MTTLLIDSGVDGVRDLAALLPAALLPAAARARIAPEMLTEPPTASALRVLATIRDERWIEFVGAGHVGWTEMLAWGRSAQASNSVRVRVEIAASLAGHPDARPDLLKSAWSLDAGNFRAVIDAMRIAREGLAADEARGLRSVHEVEMDALECGRAGEPA